MINSITQKVIDWLDTEHPEWRSLTALEIGRWIIWHETHAIDLKPVFEDLFGKRAVRKIATRDYMDDEVKHLMQIRPLKRWRKG